ncbi:hypothetical protein [Abyssisolibacter fermentans]|uniref:hypothetical protein n=1 Tax=Abyssisolibacter fermentans TaxID=1766203 RepID=UPI00082A53D9|nr:hypothetical protein [Abyssisolibacter fermentans]
MYKEILLLAALVIFGIIIIIETMVKIKKIKYKSFSFRILYLLGVYIPMSAVVIIYSHIYTDTVLDNIRVLGSALLTVLVIYLYVKKINEKKYNWLIFSIVIFVVYGCYIFACKYLLCQNNTAFLSGAWAGAFVSIGKNIKNKRKLIVSGILSILIVLVISSKFNTELSHISKPIRYTITKVESEGYKITDKDNIVILQEDKNRYKPIELSIFKIESGYKLSRIIKVEYYKSQTKILSVDDD